MHGTILGISRPSCVLADGVPVRAATYFPELLMTQTRLYTYVYIPIILSLILKNSFTKAVLVAATG
jgi:hypothetical protein